MCRLYIMLFLTLPNISCEMTRNVNVTNELVKYENYIKVSQDLDKSDNGLLKVWAAEAQVAMVSLTTRYRLKMLRHKEHKFEQIESGKWLECLSLGIKEKSKSEKDYYASEAECLKIASAADYAERRAVHQFGREIKKWRKSYRYLSSQCHQNHPGDVQAAGACLVDLIKRDNYDVAFQRLLGMKRQSMAAVYVKMASAAVELEKCLKSGLTDYIGAVRTILRSLWACYTRIRSKEILDEEYVS